jgi:hypothetical protein
MAAGLTDHRWELGEVLWERVPPEQWQAPRRKPRRRRRANGAIVAALVA